MKSIKSIIFLSIGILLIPIIAYIIKFHDHKFSEDPALWGSLGDWIAPAVGIINLIALLYLTKIVSDEDGKRLKQSLNVQRAITLSQMRNERVREFTKILGLINYNDIMDNIEGKISEPLDEKAKIIKRELETFYDSNQDLFKEQLVKEAKDLLVEKLDSIVEEIPTINAHLKAFLEYENEHTELTNKLKDKSAELPKEEKKQIRKDIKLTESHMQQISSRYGVYNRYLFPIIEEYFNTKSDLIKKLNESILKDLEPNK
jgi:hypothetical protein